MGVKLDNLLNIMLTRLAVLYLCFHTHSCSGVTDDDGETPLDIATQEGYTEVTDYLKSLPQQCKLTRIMSTQCGPIQLLSLYSCCDWRQ